MVGQRTAGRRSWVGRGAIAAAFLALRSRLSFFLPGWSNQVFTRSCHFLWKCPLGITLLCFTILLRDDHDGHTPSAAFETHATVLLPMPPQKEHTEQTRPCSSVSGCCN